MANRSIFWIRVVAAAIFLPILSAGAGYLNDRSEKARCARTAVRLPNGEIIMVATKDPVAAAAAGGKYWARRQNN